MENRNDSKSALFKSRMRNRMSQMSVSVIT